MNWRERIELNAVLQANNDTFDLSRLEEPCPEEAKAAIVREISKSRVLKRYAPRVQKAIAIAEVNRVLAEIYDAADAAAVWCGL